MKKQRFLIVAAAALALTAVAALTGALSNAQEDDVVELALIHATTIGAGEIEPPAIYPATTTVRLGQRVRLFNTSADPADFLAASPHDPVVISTDENGDNRVFELTIIAGPESDAPNAFRVENGAVTIVEFTADQAGEFFITHRQHGHGIVGKLIVEE